MKKEKLEEILTRLNGILVTEVTTGLYQHVYNFRLWSYEAETDKCHSYDFKYTEANKSDRLLLKEVSYESYCYSLLQSLLEMYSKETGSSYYYDNSPVSTARLYCLSDTDRYVILLGIYESMVDLIDTVSSNFASHMKKKEA